MFRVAHGEPALDEVPGDIREVVVACLAKDPAQRPDLGRVAARSTAAVEHLGLSPAAFWPDDVATMIDRQVASLSADLQALEVPVGQLRPPVMDQHETPAPAAAPAGQAARPCRLGGERRLPIPPDPGRRPAVRSFIGAGAAGGTVVAGASVEGGAGAEWRQQVGRQWPRQPNRQRHHQRHHQPAKQSRRQPPPSNPTTGPGSLAWRFPVSRTAQLSCGRQWPGVLRQRKFAQRLCPSSTRSAPKTGKRAWAQTSEMVSVAPQVLGKNLYFVDASGVFYAVNAASGNQVWSLTGLQVNAGERNWDATGTQVAFAPGDGSVQLLDAATGKQIWKATSPSSALWMYVEMSTAGTVYAFDPTRGIPCRAQHDRRAAAMAVPGDQGR